MTMHNDAPTVAAQQCGLEAAKKDVGAKFHFMVERAIRAYLTSATPPDVAELIRRLEGYVECCPPGFEKQHHADMLRSATALRLSAGGGWRTIDSAPHGVNVLLAYWDEALGGWHMEAEMASWGWRRDGVGNMSAHGQATHWQPLPPPPASPAVEAGHVE